MSRQLDRRATALRRLLNPTSIVVVGASNDEHRIAGRPMRYLRDYGFAGRMFAVNPKYKTVLGSPCFPTVDALPPGIDAALLMVASDQVLDIAAACGRRGIGGVVVSAAGFAELGEEGRERQIRLAEVGRAYGMRIMGPNTLGFRNQQNGVYATFATDLDSGRRVGRVAVITQSGGLGGYFGGAQLRDLGIGTGYLIDTGNEADVDAGECLEYIVENDAENISVVGLMIEGCRDGRRLLDSCLLAREKGITVVMLKVGWSVAGSASVAGHTGSMPGDDGIWDAALAAAGVLRVRDEAEFVDLLSVLDLPRRARGPGMGMLTLSGGIATMSLDACESLALQVPTFDPPDVALREKLPLVYFGNPLDASGQMANTPEALDPLLRFVLGHERIDFVMVWLAYALLSPTVGPPMMEALLAAAGSSDKPVIVLGMAPPEVRDRLRAAGVGLMEFPARALTAVARSIRQVGPPILRRPLGRVGSPDYSSIEDLSGAAAAAALPGIDLVSARDPVRPLAARLAVQVTIDPVFGPVIRINRAGAARHPICAFLCPMDDKQALAALRAVPLFSLIDGSARKPGADLSAFATMLARLSKRAVAMPVMIEADLPEVLLPAGLDAGVQVMSDSLRISLAR